MRTAATVLGAYLATYALLMFETQRDPIVTAGLAGVLVIAGWPWERGLHSHGPRDHSAL